MDFGLIKPALQTIAKLINDIRANFTSYYTNTSLTQVDKLLRVEPLTIVSKDCVNLPYLPDVMQSCLSIFSAYWLRTASFLMNVQSVRTVRILDKLNPNRDSTGFLMENELSRDGGTKGYLARENFALESMKFSLATPRTLALEADKPNTSITTINEVTNLSVGKLFDVNIGQESEKGPDGKTQMVTVKAPVAIRLIASIIPNNSITHMLALFSDDISFTERFHSWRSGRISFISDLIFCRDLAREHRKALLSDKTGVFSEVNRRAASAKKFGVLTNNPSMVASSNIYVITEEVAREVESKLGGKLSNPKIRQRVFENTYAMILVVIDRETERVTFHIEGTEQSSSLSVRDIKAQSKGGRNDDVSDLLKAMLNQQPLF